MKIKFLFAVFVLSIGFQNLFAQEIEKEISAIRREVAAINKNLKSFEQKTKRIEDLSTEGAQAVFYSSSAAEGLKKISAKIYGETYNAVGEFYYRNGALIFAFFVINRYDTQIGVEPPPRVVRVEERRLYFADGNLIRLMVGKKILRATDQNYSNVKTETLGIAENLKAAF